VQKCSCAGDGRCAEDLTVRECSVWRYRECGVQAIWSSLHDSCVQIEMHKCSVCVEGKFVWGIHTIVNKISVVM